MKKYECCGNCRHWKTVFDYKRGVCHKNPPDPDGYPSTTADESCGEFCDIIQISRKKGMVRVRWQRSPPWDDARIVSFTIWISPSWFWHNIDRVSRALPAIRIFLYPSTYQALKVRWVLVLKARRFHNRFDPHSQIWHARWQQHSHCCQGERAGYSDTRQEKTLNENQGFRIREGKSLTLVPGKGFACKEMVDGPVLCTQPTFFSMIPFLSWRRS